MAAKKIKLTAHAIERYVERIKPHLELAQAREELQILANQAQVTTLDQALGYRGKEQTCLILSEGIYAPIEKEGNHQLVITILSRSALSDKGRNQRNQRKSHKRRSKAFAKRYGRQGGQTPYQRQRLDPGNESL